MNTLVVISRTSQALDIEYVLEGHSISSSESRNVNFCPDAAPQF